MQSVRLRHGKTLLTVLVTIVVAIAVMLAAGPASADIPSPQPRFSATFVDPYSIWNTTDAQLDSMFASQAADGVDTAILQWTGVYDSGTIRTIYSPSSTSGFEAASTDLLPRFLNSAQRHGITIQLGLVLKSDLLDDPQTRGDEDLLNRIARADATIAKDLENRYGSLFTGWYIPTEPGYQTISNPTLEQLHTKYLTAIASSLHSLTPNKSVMVSPSVPRGIEGNLTGSQFVAALAPLIRSTGIDIWNLQDGFMMTAWTAADNRALVEQGQSVARETHATVWVTLFVPSPSDRENGSNAANIDELRNDLAAVTATGATATLWTYDTSLNPDGTRNPDHPSWAEQRTVQHDAYNAGGRTVWSLGAHYTVSAPAAENYPDTVNRELTDGRHGTANLTDPAWQGRQGNETQNYVIDLATIRPISDVEIESLSAADAGVHHPSTISVSTSNNSTSWTPFGTATLTDKGNIGVWTVSGKAQARYVLVDVRANPNAWVFLDEITVSGDQ